MNKRNFLKSIGIAGVGSAFFGFQEPETTDDLPYTSTNQYLQDGKFTLPNLPYAYDALEGEIDKLTMEIHHGKHHKAYVDNLNKAIVNYKKSFESLEDLMRQTNKKTDPLIRNNGGGHWNHSFFWETLSATKAQQPGSKFMKALQKNFADFDTFKTAFSAQATSRFGSGWAWVCKDKFGGLFVTSTPNQDNPLMHKLVDKAGVPVLGIDVWEHAYYLKYQNKRADYIKAFYNIINWSKVEERMG